MFRTEVLQRVRMLSLRFLSRASWPAFAVIVCARERIGQAGVLRACSWNLAEFDKLLGAIRIGSDVNWIDNQPWSWSTTMRPRDMIELISGIRIIRDMPQDRPSSRVVPVRRSVRI
jgi:hypothetical protein